MMRSRFVGAASNVRQTSCTYREKLDKTEGTTYTVNEFVIIVIVYHGSTCTNTIIHFRAHLGLCGCIVYIFVEQISLENLYRNLFYRNSIKH